jgi:hypothetical protein
MSDLLNKASLVVIPSGYKEDTVYSVVPSDGSGDLSFTRASNGTRINSAGLVEVCPWNLIQQSETFDNAGWTKQNNITVTANTITAPNGTLTADTLEKASGSGGVGFYYIVSSTNTFEQLTNFFYVKYKSGSGIVWLLGKNSGTFAFYDVINGTALSATGGMTTSIESVGNGWYKCIFSQTYVGATSTEFGIGLCLVDGTPNYNATTAATQSAYIWGAQSSISSTAKPYFPTTDRLNVPRLTYQNGGGGCPSLLLEKQSTNLFYPSDDFSGGSQNLITLTANTTETLDPSGQNTADKFIVTTSGGDAFNRIGRSIAIQNFSLSVYLKATAGQKFQLFLARDSYAQVIDTNVLTTGEWQRVVVSGSFSTTSTDVVLGFEFGYTSDDSVANQIYYLWGAQLEASSYPTSYIPTTSSSATRVADACSKTGISSLIGQTEGVIFWNGQISDVTGGELCDLNANGDKFIQIYNTLVGSTPTIGLYIQNVSVLLNNSNIATIAYNTNFKFALAYKNNDYVAYLNGVQVYVNTTIGVPATSNFSIGAYNQGNVTANKSTNQVALFKTRLTNAELASLTTI